MNISNQESYYYLIFHLRNSNNIVIRRNKRVEWIYGRFTGGLAVTGDIQAESAVSLKIHYVRFH